MNITAPNISLKDSIENFHAYILDKSEQIIHHITGPDEVFKRERLGVYYEGYFLRLLEILEKTFIVLRQLIGKEQFNQLGREYIRVYPSEHFSVRYFGRCFSNFLANHSEIDPTYVEMAAFEWSLEHVIDAKDAPQLTFEELAVLSPESWAELTLTTHPSLLIVSFSYPTPQLWQAVRHDKDRPAPQHTEQPVDWLMWRFNRKALFLAMSPEQRVMMQAIQNGENFSQVCEGLCAIMDEDKVIHFAAQTLRQWVEEGIFSEGHSSL